MEIAIFLALLPILAVFVLMMHYKLAVDMSGLIGWILTVGIAVFFFNTAVETALLASLTGIVASFGISLMVVTSILQITFMEATGSLQRIAVLLKTIAPTHRAVQILLISMGAGTVLVAMGATPVSILPPIFIALGYSPFVAVALAAIGFDALCTYSLLSIPMVVFSDMLGISLVRASQEFSVFMPLISTLIGFGMLWIVGNSALVKEGFVPCVLAGLTGGGAAIAVAYVPLFQSAVVLTGVIAGSCITIILLLYLKLSNEPIVDRSRLSHDDLRIEREMSLTKAISPWLVLVVALLVINFYQPLYQLLFHTWAMPFSVLPGQVLKTRMLWNAYTWVLISTIVAAFFFRPSPAVWKSVLTKWLRRAPRPFLSATIFFAISYVMITSGSHVFTGAFTQGRPAANMVGVLAQGSVFLFGSFYPFISAYLGMFAGFVTGSEASAIGMLAKYHVLTAKALHFDPLVINAASAIGAGLASVISPAKLQNAAATIDAIGVESQVIRAGFVIAAAMTAVTGMIAVVFLLL